MLLFGLVRLVGGDVMLIVPRRDSLEAEAVSYKPRGGRTFDSPRSTGGVPDPPVLPREPQQWIWDPTCDLTRTWQLLSAEFRVYGSFLG